MNNTSVQSRLVCGAFATIATVFASGCATPTLKRPMDYADISQFQIDCSRKAEQIRFLESQRPSRDDRLFAWATNYLTPWKEFTDPKEYGERQTVSGRHTDWIINQKLMTLARDCR